MSLTINEEKRILNIEEQLVIIQKQIRGAASEEMLNRLLALCNEQVRVLTALNTTLQTTVDTLIEEVQRLQ